MVRAACSFPVPVSPEIKTGTSEAATSFIESKTVVQAREEPTISLKTFVEAVSKTFLSRRRLSVL